MSAKRSLPSVEPLTVLFKVVGYRAVLPIEPIAPLVADGFHAFVKAVLQLFHLCPHLPFEGVHAAVDAVEAIVKGFGQLFKLAFDPVVAGRGLGQRGPSFWRSGG